MFNNNSKIDDKSLSRLQDFVHTAERANPLDESFPAFPNNDWGRLLNRLVQVYRNAISSKYSLDVARAKVTQDYQENIRHKKDLTNNINHELKTPVSILKGYLDTIINNPNIDEEQKMVFIHKCYDQVECLSNLLRDMSCLTRMDEASELIEKEPLDLSPIVAEIVKDLQESSDNKMEIENDLPDDIHVVGNKSLLQSIFHNIIQNSILYSGGTHVVISLDDRNDEELFFSITDNGCGIEAQHLDRIFERFYRVDKGRSRKLGGTGLGLSIVKNAIMIHGGTIKAEQVKPSGICFKFNIKIKAL